MSNTGNTSQVTITKKMPLPQYQQQHAERKTLGERLDEVVENDMVRRLKNKWLEERQERPEIGRDNLNDNLH